MSTAINGNPQVLSIALSCTSSPPQQPPDAASNLMNRITALRRQAIQRLARLADHLQQKHIPTTGEIYTNCIGPKRETGLLLYANRLNHDQTEEVMCAKNESYRALLAQADRPTAQNHIHKSDLGEFLNTYQR
jgi:hypothetical protein